MRLFRSLTGQLALAAGVALLIAQILTVVLLVRAEDRAALERAEAVGAQRLAETYELRATRDGPLVRRLQRRFERRGFFSVTDKPVAIGGRASQDGADALAARGFEVERVLIDHRPSPPRRGRRDAEPTSRPEVARRDEVLVLSAPLPDGAWLNVRSPLPPRRRGGFGILLIQTVLTYALLLGAVLWVARRVSSPLRALTGAARRYRVGGPTPDLPGGGPSDVRSLSAAFADLTERVRSLLAERDGLLGAVGHDLRTPITSLRLRAEQIEDEALRNKMIETLRETERLLEDVLTLARTGQADGPPELLDLADLADHAVSLAEAAGQRAARGTLTAAPIKGHRAAILRAVSNLLGNADRYGGGGTVHVAMHEGEAVLRVEDEGPGFPDGDLTAAFARGEGSRGRATGGAGLGLAIADGVARLHGGRLVTENREEGGAVVSLRLPASPEAPSS